MAGWTAVGSGSAFGPPCWVADMGPYIGPDLVPHPAYLPTEADEVDYYVGVPISGLALDDGGLFDAVADSYTYNAGAGSHEETLSGRGVDPTGARIYVAWYDPAYPTDPADLVVPTVAPEMLVPSTLVSGGLGPVRGPGHWSDWQPGYLQAPRAVPYHSILFNTQIDNSEDPFPYDGTSLGQLQYQQAQDETGLGDWRDASGSGHATFQWRGNPGQADVSAGYEAGMLDAGYWESRLPDQFPLTDFPGDPIPPEMRDDRVLGGSIQFETVSQTWVTWVDLHIHDLAVQVESDDAVGNTAHESVGTTSLFTPPDSVSFYFAYTDFLDPISGQTGTDGQTGVPVYAGPPISFTDVDTQRFGEIAFDPRSTDRTSAPYTFGPPDSDPSQNPFLAAEISYGSITTYVNDLDLSAKPKQFGIAAYSDYAVGRSLPITADFGDSLSPVDGGALFDLTLLAGASHIELDGGIAYNAFNNASHQITATYEAPRWRYWIPGGLVYPGAVSGYWGVRL